MSMQEDLQFLLREGWKLIGTNTIESPDGVVVTSNIPQAARIWRAKKRARSIIEKNRLTKRVFWTRIFKFL